MADLEQAKSRLEFLRGPGAKWSIVVSDRVADLSNDITFQFRSRMRTVSDNMDDNIENLKNLSDAHDQSFGTNYGVLIQGLPIPLLARAVFVVDLDDTIRYVEIVPEIAQEPNYEPALAALKAAAGA